VIRLRRHSNQTIKVLLALMTEPTRWRYGYDLSQETNLKAGTMYPILMRLADRGLLETTWESDAPLGRPPRHMYRLTGQGRALAIELNNKAVAPTGLRLRPNLKGSL
jgi:DNA-binding PadR family transcriptional regulator